MQILGDGTIRTRSLRAAFICFVGVGGAMLIVDYVAITVTRRGAAAATPSDHGFLPGVWPLVHLLAAIYFAFLTPRTAPLRTLGVLRGLSIQWMRLLGALLALSVYAASAVTSLHVIG